MNIGFLRIIKRKKDCFHFSKVIHICYWSIKRNWEKMYKLIKLFDKILHYIIKMFSILFYINWNSLFLQIGSVRLGTIKIALIYWRVFTIYLNHSLKLLSGLLLINFLSWLFEFYCKFQLNPYIKYEDPLVKILFIFFMLGY